MNDVKKQLQEYIKGHSIINTHSHHLPDRSFGGLTLDKLLRNTYVNWSGVSFDSTYESRAAYLDKVRYKSYFVWLQKSLQELYGFDSPLSADNWNEISQKIENAHQDASQHLRILQQNCGYQKVVLDTYWEPGSNNGHPDFFAPAFRIDPFMFGYEKGVKDHDSNDPWSLYKDVPDYLTDYVDWIKRILALKKEQGCVAIKCATAYDRGINFRNMTKEQAERGFDRNNKEKKPEDIKAFQDYLFWRICEMAAEFDLVLQCHTGMGQLTNANAMALKDAIEGNPETRFVLFHCSYPWLGDVTALIHLYPNVYPDLCWMPILSPSAAIRVLHELIEVGTADKVCWGCDTWTSEESYGAALAMEYVLTEVLEKKIQDGYLSLSDAKEVIDNILLRNAASIYQLK